MLLPWTLLVDFPNRLLTSAVLVGSSYRSRCVDDDSNLRRPLLLLLFVLELLGLEGVSHFFCFFCRGNLEPAAAYGGHAN